MDTADWVPHVGKAERIVMDSGHPDIFGPLGGEITTSSVGAIARGATSGFASQWPPPQAQFEQIGRRI